MARLEKLAESQPLVVGAAVLGLVLLYLVNKAGQATAGAVQAAGGAVATVATQGVGLLTGSNFITENQHNAANQPTDAYQGKGVLGTLGAATNSLSGGAFASLGEWLGGKTYDLMNPSTATKADSPSGGWHWFGG